MTMDRREFLEKFGATLISSAVYSIFPSISLYSTCSFATPALIDGALRERSTVVPTREYAKVQVGSVYKVASSSDEVLRREIPMGLFSLNAGIGGVQDIDQTGEQRLWSAAEDRMRGQITEYLSYFAGAYLRYPGGTEAKRFDFQGSLGPVSQRPARHFDWHSRPFYWGWDEYIRTCLQTGMKPYWQLNGFGYGENSPVPFMNDGEIIAEAQSTIPYLRQVSNLFVEISNEEFLDTANYPTSIADPDAGARLFKTRFQPIVDVIKEALPDANIINQGCDRSDYARGPADRNWNNVVFTMNGCEGFSLHNYYDGYDVESFRHRIRTRMEEWRAIKGQYGRVHITEHARWHNELTNRVGSLERATMRGALSAADFILMLSQLPTVDVACLHGLSTWQWPLFDGPLLRTGDYSPTVVYWALRVLLQGWQPYTLGTITTSENRHSDPTPYDLRAVLTRNESGTRFGLLTINRYAEPIGVQVELPRLASTTVTYQQTGLSMPLSVPPSIRVKSNRILIDGPARTLNGPLGTFASIRIGNRLALSDFAQPANNRAQNALVTSVSADGSCLTLGETDLVSEAPRSNAYAYVGVWLMPKIRMEDPITSGLRQSWLNFERPEDGTLQFDASGRSVVTIPPYSISATTLFVD